MDNQNVAQPQPQPAPEAGGSMFASVLRFLVMYFLISKGVSYFFSPSSKSDSPTQGSNSITYANLLADHDLIDFSIYLAEDSTETLVWQEFAIPYDFSETIPREKTIQVPVTPYILNNGTVTLIGKFQLHSSPKDKLYTLTLTKELTRYTTKASGETVNLISGDVQKKEGNKNEKIMHWVPAIEVQIVHDVNAYAAFPPQVADKYRLQGINYYPVIELSDFWILKEHLLPINDTLSSLELKLSSNIVWVYKFMMLSQFEQSQSFGKEYGLNVHTEGELDLMKRMFLETNPYFLGLTLCVSFVHMIFEFLAFKSEIEFWRGRENLKGLSTNLLLYNFVATVVIFLYLLDTGETSWAVWLPMAVAIFIDLWKITKGYDVAVKRVWPFLTIKGKESHKEGGTNQLDNIATKFLAKLLIPCMLAYSVYGLYAYEYKSWYSWVIGTLASLIYTGGFIMMTPQLYINYKMKTVAHMPWKVLTYRALNTFIDDMFAFIIAMPMMHRLACFRDDIIFIIYMYQKWIYKVDHSRHYLDSEAEAPPVARVEEGKDGGAEKEESERKESREKIREEAVGEEDKPLRAEAKKNN